MGALSLALGLGLTNTPAKGGWAFFTTTFMRDATVMRDSARMIDHG